MKKAALLTIIMAFMFCFAITVPTKAESQKTEKPKCPMSEMMGMDMKEKEWKGCPRGDKPMHCMINKQMIATSDGGFVVSICNKLYKYDSSLNLQKEIELPFDMGCMKKMMIDNKDNGMTEEKMEKHELPK